MTSPEFILPDSTRAALAKAVAANSFEDLNRIDIEVCARLQDEVNATGLSSLSRARRLCVTTFGAEGHVNGSGFQALFSYEDELFLDSVPEGYYEFGADALRDITLRAYTLIPGYPSWPDQESRENLMDEWMDADSSPLEAVDGEFCEIGSATAERTKFMLSNPGEFFAQ